MTTEIRLLQFKNKLKIINQKVDNNYENLSSIHDLNEARIIMFNDNSILKISNTQTLQID